MKADIFTKIWHPTEIAELEIVARGGPKSGQGSGMEKVVLKS